MMFHLAIRGFADHRWWGFARGIVPLLLLAGLIALTVWAVLRIGRAPVGTMAPQPAGLVVQPDPAVDEVRLRYARGEISREDFVQRTKDLQGDDTGLIEPPAPGAG